MELRQVYTTPDGRTFEKKAEALNHLRRPKIEEALNKVTGEQAELVNWLLDNQDVVESAFEVGTIKRVTKSERKKLAKNLENICEEGSPRTAFIREHHEAILESFRWPSVKRMKGEEKLAKALEILTNATDGNKDLATWVVDNREAVLESYKAGIEKRKVNPKAAEALKAYRERKAAEKAAREADETKAEATG